jgi:hypothetical protein
MQRIETSSSCEKTVSHAKEKSVTKITVNYCGKITLFIFYLIRLLLVQAA